uniref:Uncharacterized protein n=1 Tax=Arundo donax TaxID=35708 RepID=A0A0A9ED79_ARUDO
MRIKKNMHDLSYVHVLKIAKRLNGVQLLTVHVQWSFLVTITMMSHAIASSAFAGIAQRKLTGRSTVRLFLSGY